MKKSILLASFLIFGLFACGAAQKTSADSAAESSAMTEETAESKQVSETGAVAQVATYRSDGFYNGITSEWLAIRYDSEGKVLSIKYWNSQDETKKSITIHKQEQHQGEISGSTLDISFPDSADKLGLGLIEGQANITHKDGRFQEFMYEEK